jgi:hypothetical protein
MSDGTIVETIYGKHHRYEIIKNVGWSISFSIYRDGKYYKGSYDSLARAVEVARNEG